MPDRISKLTISGIIGYQTVSIDFSQNPIFIVGPNGTGKSTALKITHAILSGQWKNLRDLSFENIDIDYADGFGVIIEKNDFEIVEKIEDNFSRSHKKFKRGKKYPELFENANSFIAGYQALVGHGRKTTLEEEEYLEETYHHLAIFMNCIESTTKGRVLYFPTYRRVERDISDLLDENEEVESRIDLRPKIVDRFQISGEVVGFGGQDIANLLTKTAEQIEVQARRALSDHSVNFLASLTSSKHSRVLSITDVLKSPSKTARLIERIQAFGGLNVDLVPVQSGIVRLASKVNYSVELNTAEDNMLLTYLSGLQKVFEQIDALYEPLQRFADLLTMYLRPSKAANLNVNESSIKITNSTGYTLTIDQLSSGEKQILAFFAFLLLKVDISPKYILIDEPELSLSVSWQKSLIRDIQQLSQGASIIVATHSPFIFHDYNMDQIISLGEL